MSDQRTRNRIKSLKVEEVSLVDRPANSAARFVLAKRDDMTHPDDCTCKNCKKERKMTKAAAPEVEDEITDEELDELENELVELESELSYDEGEEETGDEEEFVDDEDLEDDVESSYEPEYEDEDEAASDEVGKAYTLFNGAKARTSIWPMVNALQESLTSIVNDVDSDEDEKKTALSKTVSQFEKEAQRLLGEAETVTKFDEEEDEPMGSTHLEKRLTELHDQNVELEKRLADLTEERALEKRLAKARSILGKNAKDEEVTRMAGILKSGSEDDVKFVESLAKRAAEAERTSRVFEEIGVAKGQPVGTSTAVEEMAQDLQKRDPKLTRAQAITKAYEALGDEAYLADDEDLD